MATATAAPLLAASHVAFIGSSPKRNLRNFCDAFASLPCEKFPTRFSRECHLERGFFSRTSLRKRRHKKICQEACQSRAERRGRRAVLTVSAAQSTDVSTSRGDVQLGGLFGGVEVVTAEGESREVLGLWRDRRVVVAWARHFGCLLCKKRAAELAKRKGELDVAGVTLVIIGPGSPEQAKSFKEQTNFPGEVYADPTSATFQKLGFVFGAGTIFTPQALVYLVGASLEGYRQDWGLSLQKDTVTKGAWQQGGVLVAGPGIDTLLFLHKDKEAGDEPDWDEVVNVATKS